MSRYARIPHALAVLSAVILLMLTHRAGAWHDEGHYYAAVAAAAKAMPDDVPAFFREGSATIGHNALDPDVFKSRALPQLNHCEFPEHFIDLEMLQGRELPKLRYEYLAMCYEMGVDPSRAGTLPYSIAEWTQRLTMAFAEYRADPENPHARAKCLVYAGILSHYSADLHMPLHTSIHWDGRNVEGQPYQRTGIHNKIDALPTKIPFNQLFAEPLRPALAVDDVFAHTLAELAKSHALVDLAYELEPIFPDWSDMDLADEAARAFTTDRTRASAAFTADLFLSAWRTSENVAIPSWLDRKMFDNNLDLDKVPPQPNR